MPWWVECLCCAKDIAAKEKKGPLPCITVHEDFIAGHLRHAVLDMALTGYFETRCNVDHWTGESSKLPRLLFSFFFFEAGWVIDCVVHRAYRMAAYCQCICWVYSRWLGRGHRHWHQILACAGYFIRDVYPDEPLTVLNTWRLHNCEL